MAQDSVTTATDAIAALRPTWTLGDRLAKARKHAGLEQEDMAKLFNVGRAAISHWEADRTQPRNLVQVIAGWAAATGVDRDWLIWGEAAPSSAWVTADELVGAAA